MVIAVVKLPSLIARRSRAFYIGNVVAADSLKERALGESFSAIRAERWVRFIDKARAPT
jgi:hypothetical protein